MILMKWDLSKRLIDLDVANRQDAMMLFLLVAVMVLGFIGNMVIMSLPGSEPRSDHSKHYYWFSGK